MKDTTDFLLKLNAIKSVPDNGHLVSLDVKFLYTSIPNAEGIKVGNDKHTTKNVATKLITTFLALIPP